MKTRRKTLRTHLLIGAAFAAAGAVHAEGLSIGANIGGSHFKSQDLPGLPTDHSTTGGKLYGGYSINPYLGVEGGWVDLGKFKGPAGNLRGSGLFVDGVGTLPLGNNVSVLGRLGVFNGRLDDSATDHDRGTSVKLGAGLEYAIDKNLAVRGEWERYHFDALNSAPNVDLYSVGLRYRF